MIILPVFLSALGLLLLLPSTIDLLPILETESVESSINSPCQKRLCYPINTGSQFKVTLVHFHHYEFVEKVAEQIILCEWEVSHVAQMQLTVGDYIVVMNKKKKKII